MRTVVIWQRGVWASIVCENFERAQKYTQRPLYMCSVVDWKRIHYFDFLYIFVLMSFSILFAIFGNLVRPYFECSVLMHESGKRKLLFESNRSISCRDITVIVLILDLFGRRTVFRYECLGHFLMASWGMHVVQFELSPRLVSALTDTFSRHNAAAQTECGQCV